MNRYVKFIKHFQSSLKLFTKQKNIYLAMKLLIFLLFILITENTNFSIFCFQINPYR